MGIHYYSLPKTDTTLTELANDVTLKTQAYGAGSRPALAASAALRKHIHQSYPKTRYKAVQARLDQLAERHAKQRQIQLIKRHKEAEEKRKARGGGYGLKVGGEYMLYVRIDHSHVQYIKGNGVDLFGINPISPGLEITECFHDRLVITISNTGQKKLYTDLMVKLNSRPGYAFYLKRIEPAYLKSNVEREMAGKKLDYSPQWSIEELSEYRSRTGRL